MGQSRAELPVRSGGALLLRNFKPVTGAAGGLQISGIFRVVRAAAEAFPQELEGADTKWEADTKMGRQSPKKWTPSRYVIGMKGTGGEGGFEHENR